MTRLGFTAGESTELGRLLATLLKNEHGVPGETDRRIGELIDAHRKIVL
ncbi:MULTISPECIES: hypothetical protein [Streptomyces]|nr:MULTISPECIES: hypothetical protein [Streptomyces]WFB88565.1 hypothetical protein MMU79_37675 [Streptomyces olivaceus]WGK50706.1 hypothetical protein M6G09_36700 [Streptomyces sp. B146]